MALIMKRLLILLILLLGLSASAQIFYVGQFAGLDYGNTGITNSAGQTIDQRATTAVTNSLIGANENVKYYVNPVNGSDLNVGTNRNFPLKSYWIAANLAGSNAPATVDLMAGTYQFYNYFSITSAQATNGVFLVPPYVNVIGEPGNLVQVNWTNTTTALGAPDLQACGNNRIEGVNFIFSSPTTTDVPIGAFSGVLWNTNYNVSAAVATSCTNVLFKNCTVWFQATGIHLEGSADATAYGYTFDSCKIIANANLVQMRVSNALVQIQNSEIWLMNWTNNTVVNPKPFRLIESRTLPNTSTFKYPVRMFNDIVHYSDNDMSASNRPVFIAWNTAPGTPLVNTNVALMVNCLLDPLSITNPLSVDITSNFFDVNSNCSLTIQNVSRLDVGYLTTNAGYPVRLLPHW